MKLGFFFNETRFFFNSLKKIVFHFAFALPRLPSPRGGPLLSPRGGNGRQRSLFREFHF